jgi:ParB-like nuclease domain
MKKRRLDVDPRNVTPLHRIKKGRLHHLRELIRRLRESGWQGRPLLVERIGRNRYQAWTGTHRLAAARRLRMRRVPVVVIDHQKWLRRWGPPEDLIVDEVDDDFDKYVALLQAGDLMAARIMHQECELNLGGDAQRCL